MEARGVVVRVAVRRRALSIWKLIVYLKEEISIVLGTSSSESALPRMMSKLENLGCARPVVGLVIPTGYSFNLDGTSIYLTMRMASTRRGCTACSTAKPSPLRVNRVNRVDRTSGPSGGPPVRSPGCAASFTGRFGAMLSG